MNLLESLVDAIVRLDGDALVMHVGEKPYVVTTSAAMSVHRGPIAWGQVELSSRVLTSEGVLGMIAEILPSDLQQSLDAFGAVEHEVTLPGSVGRFTIVAARGGDDVWLELKRRQPQRTVWRPAAEPGPAAPTPTGAQPAVRDAAIQQAPKAAERRPSKVAPAIAEAPVARTAPPNAHLPETAVPSAPVASVEAGDASLAAGASQLDIDEPIFVGDVEMASGAVQQGSHVDVVAANAPVARQLPVVDEHAPINDDAAVADALLAATASALLTTSDEDLLAVLEGHSAHEAIEIGDAQVEPIQESAEHAAPLPPQTQEISPAGPPVVLSSAEPRSEIEAPAASVHPAVPVVEPPVAASEAVRMSDEREEAPRAVVVPITRMRAEPPTAEAPPSVDADALQRILSLAANRGASTVYVVTQSRPMVRVEGEISPLDEESVLTAADVDLFIKSLGAVDEDETESVEWLSDVPEVGRVRHLTFHDHRGPGIIFRMIPPRVLSAEQLGLSPEVQGLCAQPDGLVIVTGAAMSGKSTLLSAFVDLINRNRSDHVITIESQIRFVHESHRSFVSQREVRGGGEAVAHAARRALREDPDVLFIGEISSADVATVALEAGAGGRLVFGSVQAPSTTAAIEQLIEYFPAERRAQMRTSLAGSLRGVVAQVLLRKLKGGRVAAREVLLNSQAVASLILEGKTVQLPAALDAGRRHGMMPLTDSLAVLVRDGIVHIGEAYRKAGDRDALLAVLKREGIDTSFAERLA